VGLDEDQLGCRRVRRSLTRDQNQRTTRRRIRSRRQFRFKNVLVSLIGRLFPLRLSPRRSTSIARRSVNVTPTEIISKAPSNPKLLLPPPGRLVPTSRDTISIDWSRTLLPSLFLPTSLLGIIGPETRTSLTDPPSSRLRRDGTRSIRLSTTFRCFRRRRTSRHRRASILFRRRMRLLGG